MPVILSHASHTSCAYHASNKFPHDAFCAFETSLETFLKKILEKSSILFEISKYNSIFAPKKNDCGILRKGSRQSSGHVSSNA
jgi:hypothetical protein